MCVQQAYDSICTAVSLCTDHEYCQSEFFNVSCTSSSLASVGVAKRHVVLIDSAKYGRMREGRCAKSEFGRIGCSQDVTWYLDRKCSGRSKCKVYIADQVLHKLDKCPKDLSSYLEARHRCIPGEICTVA